MDNAQAYTLTLTHPSNASTRTVDATGLTMPPRGGNPRTLTFKIFKDFALYSVIGGTYNPLDYDSLVVLTRNAQTLFRGYVVAIREVLNGNGARGLEVNCVCQSARLRKTLAHYNGALNYERTAPIADLTNIALIAMPSGAGGYGTDVLYPVYPAFAHATNSPDSNSPWIARSVSRTTTITQNMTDVATTPFTVADGRQLTEPGFIQIGTELIHYSNKYKSGSTWYVGGTIKRGVLGSTAAAHTSGDQCWQRELKTITDGPHVLEYGGGTVPRHKYQIREAEGRFDFLDSFATYAGSSACDYQVYDMDHATNRITLASIITEWLTATRAYGGPEIAGGDIDTSGCDLILLDRIVVDEAQGIYTWDVIQRLIAEAWEKRGGTTRKVDFYYSAINNKWTLESTYQAATASVVYSHATERTTEYTLDGLAESVVVSYDVSAPTDLLSAERVYHLAIGDAANLMTSGSTTTTAVTKIMYQQVERALAYGWQEDASAGNNVQTTYLFDPDPGSGWGIKFAAAFWATGEPGTRILYAWFPAAAVQTVDYIELVYDCRMFIGGFFEIEVFGVDSYTPGDPPTVGNVVPLGIDHRIGNYAGGMTHGQARHLVRNVPGGTVL